MSTKLGPANSRSRLGQQT